jgi:hypothetical protein
LLHGVRDFKEIGSGETELATIEKRYLAPLNAPPIREADRSRVYGIVGKELTDVLAGDQSYYPDGVQKDPRVLASDLDNFIASIKALQERVDDPSNILGMVSDVLKRHAYEFRALLQKNQPVDNIEIPPEHSPITSDRNDIYVDPDPGPYSPPNPVSPNQRPRYFNAPFDLSDDTRAPQQRRLVSSALAGNNPSNRSAPSPQFGQSLGIYSGKPMPQWIVPPPIFNTR